MHRILIIQIKFHSPESKWNLHVTRAVLSRHAQISIYGQILGNSIFSQWIFLKCKLASFNTQTIPVKPQIMYFFDVSFLCVGYESSVTPEKKVAMRCFTVFS